MRKEDIFMEQPTGYERGLNMVCKLKKSIYGLKQSGREWNTVITSFFKERNFRVSDVYLSIFPMERRKINYSLNLFG
jgi:hypothetical protein